MKPSPLENVVRPLKYVPGGKRVVPLRPMRSRGHAIIDNLANLSVNDGVRIEGMAIVVRTSRGTLMDWVGDSDVGMSESLATATVMAQRNVFDRDD